VARRARVELTTVGSEVRCSIH